MLTQYKELSHKDPLSIFLFVIVHLGICTTIALFLLIIGYILFNGVPYLSLSLFEWHYTIENASMTPAIINTFSMVIVSLAIAAPIAILGAIYLNEYAKPNSLSVATIGIAAETLVGIPSIVYGLFGFLAFVLYCGMGFSFLAGTLSLSIMVLPLILRNTQEALKSVPLTYKEGSFGLGAGKLRTIFRVVLPCAISGILAGVILGIGRIVGESAALLYTSGTIAKIAGPLDSGRTLSVHLYALLSEGQQMEQAAATAVILLLFVMVINFCSNFIAKKLNPYNLD